MGSSLNGVDPCPYLVSLNLDEFIIGKPPIMSSNLDDHHEPFIKNPSSSSTPVVNVNPDTKPAYNDVWNDQMKNPLDYMMQNCGLRSVEEDFLQDPTPMMTKIDQEYLNWQQQQEMMDGMKMQTADFRVFEGGFDENKVTTTELVVAEDSGLEMEKNNGSNELMKDEMMMKSVERRQKRMIKNRESAARSRARKQDYVNQLQQKVSQLQTWNKLLKMRKEAYALWNSNQISEPRFQLRRTTSAPF